MTAKKSKKTSKEAGVLIAGFVFCLCAGCAVNPITGEDELMLIGEEQDVQIGKHYAPEIEKQMGGRIEDEALQEYIDSVGQKVARVSQKPNLEYHFVALNHKSVNAFALPGGYLFVTRGMLENLETEAQLAGVLAHEIVHVVARDTANMMSNEMVLSTLMMGAAIAGGSDAATTAQVAHMIVGLQYSKSDERQADVGGMKYMVRAGYDPQGMVETMEMFESRRTDTFDDFLSTHPSPINRVGYLKRRIRRKYADRTALKIGKEDYQKSVLDRLPKPDA